jgi:tetratricopeptide (TPR) repeat protein
MQVRKSLLIIAALVFACLLFYFNTLSADFVWDDRIFLVENPHMMSFSFLTQFFTKDFWNVYDSSVHSLYYRPLLAASFMLDYSTWKLEPFGYHFTNLLLHILVCVFVFIFVRLLIKDLEIAFISSLIFSVHPVHTEAVSFISGRVDLIPCLFMLLSLVLFLKYFSKRKVALYISSLLCFAVALLAKEMAATLPLLILCIDYLFLSQNSAKRVMGNFLRLHMSFFVLLGGYLIVRYYFVGLPFAKDNFTSIPFLRSNLIGKLGCDVQSGYFWPLINDLKIFAFYVGLLFCPYNLKLVPSFDPAFTIFEPAVLTGLALVLILSIIAFRNIKKYPILSFSAFWFFITILPVSNIISKKQIFAERYMYIPSIGFCVGLGFLFSWVLKQNIKTRILNWRKYFYAVLFLYLIAFGQETYERNKVWENDFILWYDASKAIPENYYTHINLAVEYSRFQAWDKAVDELRAAFKINNSIDYKALYLLAYAYSQKGEVDRAIKAYQKVTEIKPDFIDAYYDLSIAYSVDDQHEKAIETGLKTLEKDPGFYRAYYIIACNYRKLGRIDEAIKAYEEFMRNNQNSPKVFYELGELYRDKGDLQKARGQWLKALETSKDYQPAKDALKLLEE